MSLTRIDISMTLVSPFLTSGDAGPAFGLDMILPRAPGSGRVIVPGTLLRGSVRDALLSLCSRGGGKVPGAPDLTIERIEQFFGRESGKRRGEGESGAISGPDSELPERGCLAFSDFEAETPEIKDGSLTRIHVDEALGTVKEGHLQVIEMPWPIGARVTFTGTVVVTPEADPALVEKALKHALAVIPALGSAKSAGFGALASSVVGLRPVTPRIATPVASSPDGRYRATLEFEGPFLVTADRVAPNVFSGSVTIPGGVIKGAVARISNVTDSATPLGRFLARTVFGEAWPETPGMVRPVTPPFSLSVHRIGHAGQLNDALFEDMPAPQTTGGAQNVVGVFGVDWKDADADAVDRSFPALSAKPTVRSVARSLARAVRTRTKIDYAKGTADQGEEIDGGGGLFVYDMVAPYREGRKVSWQFDIVLEDDTDFASLTELVGLEILIGKLPTVARITAIEPINEAASQYSKFAGRVHGLKGAITYAYALHLVTPALLTPLEALRSAHGDVAEVYRESFRSIFETDVELIRFYARQRLIGGWQALRYPSTKGHYDPWILTEAGSVFLLVPPREDQEKFRRVLERVLTTGLPEQGVPVGESWRTCPFPRINGFGEVALWSPKAMKTPLK